MSSIKIAGHTEGVDTEVEDSQRFAAVNCVGYLGKRILRHVQHLRKFIYIMRMPSFSKTGNAAR